MQSVVDHEQHDANVRGTVESRASTDFYGAWAPRAPPPDTPLVAKSTDSVVRPEQIQRPIISKLPPFKDVLDSHQGRRKKWINVGYNYR